MRIYIFICGIMIKKGFCGNFLSYVNEDFTGLDYFWVDRMVYWGLNC